MTEIKLFFSRKPQKCKTITDKDVDNDALEKRMLLLINVEKQAIKRWHLLLSKITICRAFRLQQVAPLTRLDLYKS